MAEVHRPTIAIPADRLTGAPNVSPISPSAKAEPDAPSLAAFQPVQGHTVSSESLARYCHDPKNIVPMLAALAELIASRREFALCDWRNGPRRFGEQTPLAQENFPRLIDAQQPTVAITSPLSEIPGQNLLAVASAVARAAGHAVPNIIYLPPCAGSVITKGDRCFATAGAILDADGVVHHGLFPNLLRIHVVDSGDNLAHLLPNAGALHLASLTPPEGIRRCLNKKSVRDLLQKAGVAIAPGITISHGEPTKLDEFLQRNEAKQFVVKPIDKSGCRGVAFVDRDDLASHLANRLPREQTLLVEERIIPGTLAPHTDWNLRVLATQRGIVDIELRKGIEGSPVSRSQGSQAFSFPQATERFLEQNNGWPPGCIRERLSTHTAAVTAALGDGFYGIDVILNKEGTPISIEVNVQDVGGIETLAELRRGADGRLSSALRLLTHIQHIARNRHAQPLTLPTHSGQEEQLPLSAWAIGTLYSKDPSLSTSIAQDIVHSLSSPNFDRHTLSDDTFFALQSFAATVFQANGDTKQMDGLLTAFIDRKLPLTSSVAQYAMSYALRNFSRDEALNFIGDQVAHGVISKRSLQGIFVLVADEHPQSVHPEDEVRPRPGSQIVSDTNIAGLEDLLEARRYKDAFALLQHDHLSGRSQIQRLILRRAISEMKFGLAALTGSTEEVRDEFNASRHDLPASLRRLFTFSDTVARLTGNSTVTAKCAQSVVHTAERIWNWVLIPCSDAMAENPALRFAVTVAQLPFYLAADVAQTLRDAPRRTAREIEKRIVPRISEAILHEFREQGGKIPTERDSFRST